MPRLCRTHDRRMGYGEARDGHDLGPMRTALRIATRDSWDRLRSFASEHEISVELLADSADGSGDMLTALADAGHDALIKSMPINRAVAGGFTIDHQECTATCPAGQTRSTSPKGNVTFGAVCSGCPLREHCTKAKDGRKMIIGVHDPIKREHRVKATEPDSQAVYRQHRAMVERSVAVTQ